MKVLNPIYFIKLENLSFQRIYEFLEPYRALKIIRRYPDCSLDSLLVIKHTFSLVYASNYELTVSVSYEFILLNSDNNIKILTPLRLTTL